MRGQLTMTFRLPLTSKDLITQLTSFLHFRMRMRSLTTSGPSRAGCMSMTISTWRGLCVENKAKSRPECQELCHHSQAPCFQCLASWLKYWRGSQANDMCKTHCCCTHNKMGLHNNRNTGLMLINHTSFSFRRGEKGSYSMQHHLKDLELHFEAELFVFKLLRPALH